LRDERNELIRKKRLKRQLLKSSKERRWGRFQQTVSRLRPGDIWPRPVAPYLISRDFAVVKVPEQFSFIEDPISTMRTLGELSAAVKKTRILRVFIDFERCRTLDLCASTAMTVILLQAIRGRRRKAFELRGNYPSNERAKILLRSSGLLKYLKTTAPILPAEIESKLLVMDICSGYSGRPEKSVKCDQATTKLVDYVNDCLSRSGATLTPYGRSKLGTLVGETITNAEEHSRGFWYAAAHFDRLDPEEQEGGACHILLMNFGSTISESFALPDSSPERLTQLQQLAARHRERRFFDLRSRAYNEEALYTLYALQEGVSRSKERRGLGTMYLIDFFLKLSATGARMCILSGTAFILFEGTYALRAAQLEGGERKVIAFNESNSLEDRPDDRFVWAMPSRFPGTLISLRFKLKRDYISEFPIDGSICPITS
jgi:hypothetical protein